MSNSSTEISIKNHSAVFNHGIKLNPCMGCIYRCSCYDAKYLDQDSYCRHKKTKLDSQIRDLKTQGCKEVY